MPRGDRTGPAGMGPMTGRRAGYCAGYPTPGFANPGVGGGYGYWGGGGGGRGWRNRYYATGLPRWARAGYPPAWDAAPYAPAPPAPDQEAAFLKSEAEHLRATLEQIEKRLSELGNDQ